MSIAYLFFSNKVPPHVAQDGLKALIPLLRILNIGISGTRHHVQLLS